MSSPRTDGLAAARGVVRLLNTAGGGALCLAGEVDDAAVDSFLRRYGSEPARVDRIDAGSVTALSRPGLALVIDHLEAAERGGRSVELRSSPAVAALLGPAAHEPAAREPAARQAAESR